MIAKYSIVHSVGAYVNVGQIMPHFLRFWRTVAQKLFMIEYQKYTFLKPSQWALSNGKDVETI